MPENILQILTPVIVLIIGGVLLPKQVFKFFRELIIFIFQSTLKFWYIFIPVTGVLLFFKFKEYLPINNLISLLAIVAICLLVAVFNFILILRRWNRKPNIAFYGCYSIKEGDYLSNDVDSAILEQRTSEVVETIAKNHFIYKNGFLDTDFIALPNFYTNLLGLKKLNSFISHSTSKKHLASLYFISNISEQSVYSVIKYNKGQLANSEHINQEIEIINDISSNDKINNNKKVELIVRIYCMIFGQSFNDYLLDNELYKELHHVTDDNLKLLNTIGNEFEELKLNEKYKVFIDFWISSNYRHKSLTLFKQDEFTGSIEYAFKALEINPYYPYRNYVELKQDYTKIYGSKLVPSIFETRKMVDIESNEDSINYSKFLLENQTKYPQIPHTYVILDEILQQKQSKEIRELIQKNFDKLDNENPFILLCKSETFKYMKKGKEKYNEIYVGRFDDCIKILEKIKSMDPEFTLIRTKLGIMKFLKAMHNGDEDLLKEGLKEWKTGAHFIKELGLE